MTEGEAQATKVKRRRDGPAGRTFEHTSEETRVMHLRESARANPQQAIVTSALAVITAHLVLSSLVFMEASHFERVFWAVAATTALGITAYLYSSLQLPARVTVCLLAGLPATIFGLGIHASHVVQAGIGTSDYTGIAALVAGVLLTATGGTVLVRSIHTWWRRLLLLPPGLALAFFVVFPVGLGVFATNVARIPCCDETPADYGFAYEDVTFETAQGLELSAWFIPSQNGAVVITVHGAGRNRSTVMPEATMLARNGYGVLMVDLEGIGNSEGRANMFGWVGARDIDAAVRYLVSRPDVDPVRIGGLGLSMGGEVLIQAAGQTPGLAAIVAEGASARTAADVGEMEGFEAKYIIVPIHTVVGTTMTRISGEHAPPPLMEMAAQIGPKPVLLIAGEIREEVELGRLYVEVGGPSFEMWTYPESQHIKGYDLHPEEYEQRVVGFLDRALLGSGGVAVD